MSEASPDPRGTDHRIAQRLRSLRAGQGWTLEEVARRSGVSRATLSRIENAEVSVTAAVLGRLCSVYGLPMSRLMYLIEEGITALCRRADQQVWTDPGTGFSRRLVSPPAQGLQGEVLECRLGPGVAIDYPEPSRPGLEHHLVMLEGELGLTVDGVTHDLRPGDCLRYLLHGPTAFRTGPHSGAAYLLFLV